MLKILREIVTSYAPDNVFIPLLNWNNRMKGRRANVARFEDHIYTVDDGQAVVYLCRRSRVGRYFYGVHNQCQALANQYLLNKVEFNPGDVIIDCGANNGEIGIWSQTKNLKYFAFEPEALESRCCDLNNYQGQRNTTRKGLWYEKTTLRWYSKPESADSSLIEIDGSENVTSVETTTLTDFVHENNIDRIRLFKLEAEGAEPEVLKGALSVLDKIDYIAVDCGYERGIDKKHTFMEVYTTLREHDFDIVAAEFKRVVVLFKRRNAA